MKKVFTIVVALVFVFAVGLVLADEYPVVTEGKEVGTVLNTEAPGMVIATPAKDFSHPLVSDALVDVGAQIYASAFEMTGAESITGAAAGGVARDDENTRIWDHLMDVSGTLNVE